jgi:uncharacterized YigZ family protein
MSIDTWETVAGEVEDELKVSRSTFLAIAFPVAGEDAFQERLLQIQKQYFDATHHCWAFRLFQAGSVLQRSADAGEPSGTAGRPILGAIESAGLHDVGCVVVRYYGGVKLGTGGLARAYAGAVNHALDALPRAERVAWARLRVEVDYGAVGGVQQLLPAHEATVLEQLYSDTVTYVVQVPEANLEALRAALLELTSGKVRFVGES